MKVVDRKILRKKTLGKSDEEVLREVAVMKRLTHQNVVRLHEVIDDPKRDKFYMLQEYMALGQIMPGTERTNRTHGGGVMEEKRR